MNLTANVFDEMGIYWSEIADKNQTEKQIQFLKSHLKRDGYVLDLACGTGRHSTPLSQQGFNMVGLDVSVNLLQIAKKRYRQVQLVRGDMRFLPFKPQAFAAVVSMDTSFGYLPSERDDRASLTEVRRALIQRGVFVVDVFNIQELIAKYTEKNHPSKWKEYPSFFLQQKRTLSQSGNLLCDLWTIRDKASGRLVVFEHTARLYKRIELEGLVANAGFAIERIYGGYEGEDFDLNSPRLILVTNTK